MVNLHEILCENGNEMNILAQRIYLHKIITVMSVVQKMAINPSKTGMMKNWLDIIQTLLPIDKHTWEHINEKRCKNSPTQLSDHQGWKLTASASQICSFNWNTVVSPETFSEILAPEVADARLARLEVRRSASMPEVGTSNEGGGFLPLTKSTVMSMFV
jgi:hypothetical protein